VAEKKKGLLADLLSSQKRKPKKQSNNSGTSDDKRAVRTHGAGDTTGMRNANPMPDIFSAIRTGGIQLKNAEDRKLGPKAPTKIRQHNKFIITAAILKRKKASLRKADEANNEADKAGPGASEHERQLQRVFENNAVINKMRTRYVAMHRDKDDDPTESSWTSSSRRRLATLDNEAASKEFRRLLKSVRRKRTRR